MVVLMKTTGCACARSALAFLAVALIVTSATAGVVNPPAGLDEDAVRFHPDQGLAFGGPKFNVYVGGGLAGEGWSQVDSAEETFASGEDFSGVFRSAVWESDANGNLLFTYQIENTSGGACPRSIRLGNLVTYPSEVRGIDCGVIHPGGTDEYQTGDVLALERYTGQFAFAFEAQGTQKLLAPGQTSSWFYVETDATAYGAGLATVQDSGKSAGGIPVLVPVPEPTMLSLLALGAVGLLLRHRRRKTS